VAAEEQRDKGGFGNFSGIVTVLMLIAGAIWVSLPLEGRRPFAPVGGMPLTGLQDVDARLWQDPFAAVAKARKQDEAQAEKALQKRALQVAAGANAPADTRTQTDELHSEGFLRRLVRYHADSGGVAVLGVMMLGHSYVGAEEYRRRTRYAVLSALMDAAYMPDDPEHIGYVTTDSARGRGYPRVVPYEWFSGGGDPLLVVWLDESALMQQRSLANPSVYDDPMRRLADLLKGLVGRKDNVRLDIIGPSGSDTVLRMAQEFSEYRQTAASTPTLLGEMTFYSPFATLSDERFCQEWWYWETPKMDCKAELMLTAPPNEQSGLRRFVRMIAPDDKVVDALAGELRARGVGDGSYIAIVGELDTQYSRDLAGMIKSAWPAPERFVHQYGYMRGIDGRHAGQETGADAKKGDDKARGRQQIEQPEGNAQIDYLRRLAERMRQRESELKRPAWGPRPRYAAIGVVGMDYYDKLLALQALRPMFPEAVFFTTDLDAAMLHPVDNEVTRNLIVASGFGLALHPDLQGGTPPFRDSYQTAAHMAVKMSLAVSGSTEQLLKATVERWLKPTVWEVGYSRLFDLNDHVGPCDPSPLRCENPYDVSRRRSPIGFWPALAVLAAGLVFVCLAFRESVVYPLWERRSRWWMRRLVLPGGALVAGLVALALFDMLRPSGEPFAWFQGVSVWPSNLIRLAGLVVAVGATALLFDSIRARLEKTQQAFFPPGVVFVPAPADKADHVNPLTAWNCYLEKASAKKFGMDALGQATVMFVFFVTLIPLSPEMAIPVRSPISHGINVFIVIVAVACTFYLLNCVALLVRRTNRLVRDLSRKTWWPDEMRRRYGLPAGSAEHQLDDWIDLQLICRQTETVNHLIYFPFCALLLLLLARSRVFDNWSLPPQFLVVIGFCFLYLVVCAMCLRSAAERARTNALHALQRKLVLAQGTTAGAPLVEKCKLLIEQTQKLDRGAFMPFTQQPVVRAVLALLGGLSGAALIEYATMVNL
jgi:hypothetical protein